MQPFWEFFVLLLPKQVPCRLYLSVPLLSTSQISSGPSLSDFTIIKCLFNCKDPTKKYEPNFDQFKEL